MIGARGVHTGPMAGPRARHWVLHVDLDPRSSTGVTVNEILGYVGLTIAGVLMLRVVATIVRDGRS